MSSATDRTGGLCLASSESLPQSGPLRDGPDISWLPKCRVGDDQRREGACAIFAMANWSEVMHSHSISDNECLELYASTLKKLSRRTTSGLTFAEAFAAARDAGWLPGSRAMARVRDLSRLAEQPIVAGYDITGAWDYVSSQGCLDHDAKTPSRGYHAVLIVAHGALQGVVGGPWVFIENSWGTDWGWNGIGVMSEDLHRSLCREMWVIE